MYPLNVGSPVTGRSFIGRETELEMITHLLSMGQSVVLIAPRRFGKTSLAMQVMSKLAGQDFYTGFVDVFSTPDIRTLSLHITESVLKNHRLDQAFRKTRNSVIGMIKNLKLKTIIEDFEFMLGFGESRIDNWHLLEQSIDFIDQFSSKHKKRMVCAFDEFGDIRKLDGDKIAKVFRSKIQGHQNTSYLLSGSYESVMQSMFVDRQAPFFRFARIIELGPIDQDSFKKYYLQRLKEYQMDPPEDLIDSILDFTGGHPYYSQLALQEIIIHQLFNQEIPGFDQLIQAMLIAERNYLELTWEELSSSKELVTVLLAIVEHRSDLYGVLKYQGINIYRALNNLKNRGLVSQSPNKSYYLNDPLLDYWIRKNILRIL